MRLFIICDVKKGDAIATTPQIFIPDKFYYDMYDWHTRMVNKTMHKNDQLQSILEE